MDKAKLILNKDGSVYHLGLLPQEISSTILTVGDPERVPKISRFFDHIEFRKQKREICTHTGHYRGKRLSVISTGMGTDNIDIVLNELDALVNINLTTGEPKTRLTPLTIIRLGTSGAIQPESILGEILLSEYAVGVDNLMTFYDQKESIRTPFSNSLYHYFKKYFPEVTPYIAKADTELMQHFNTVDFKKGITVTHPGFYGPQGRESRLELRYPSWVEVLKGFAFEGQQLTNFDMETAGILALSSLMGHRALSINVILANRWTGTFSPQPEKDTERMIASALERISLL